MSEVLGAMVIECGTIAVRRLPQISLDDGIGEVPCKGTAHIL